LISTAPAEQTGAPPLARPRVLDAVIVLSYFLVAFALYRDLWLNLGHGYLLDSGEDQDLFEWFFAVQAQALAHGHPTLFSALQNHPAGVNLMGNTAMPGLALPLAPLTWLSGPTLTWAVILTGGLAGTATGWYLLYSRHLVRSRWAAAIGGACCAFAPPVISHAYAHPNFTATFVLPAIVLMLLRLTRTRGRRQLAQQGVVLGALLAWQVMIGEEPLLILATGVVVFALAWAAVQPREVASAARHIAPGLTIAALITVLLVGYPLWVQFAGPASYHALEHGPAGNDLSSFGALPRQSLGGRLLHPDEVVGNPTEQNAFFGWPLLLLLLVVMIWLWREVPARVASITLVVIFALSVGAHAYWKTHDTGIPGPWLLIGRLPLYDSLIEARMSFAALPVIGMLLALASDRVLHQPPHGLGWLTTRRLWFLALALAVIPILPLRFTVVTRPNPPAFFTDGAWHEYLRPGRALVTVPLPDASDAGALHWQVAAGLGFPIAEGYFVGPAGPSKQGTYGAVPRATSQLLAGVARSGAVGLIGPAQRADAVADLRYWQADAVVLPLTQPNQAALRATLRELLGPGQVRDGVVVWDVRPLLR
jgi:hypothetical protein